MKNKIVRIRLKSMNFKTYLEYLGIYDLPPIDYRRRWYWYIWYSIKWTFVWQIAGIFRFILPNNVRCKLFGHKPVELTNMYGDDIYTSDICQRCGKEING